MSFLDSYSAKLVEYVLGAGYLILFVIFWNYIASAPMKEAKP